MMLDIAVAHEWLTNWAGSEQVMAAIVCMTRAQRLLVSVADERVAQAHLPHGVQVEPMWLSRLPKARTNWHRYAPAMMASWASKRIEADALIVSSHFAAHGATHRFSGPSIVYYHTPARLLWRPDLELGRIPPLWRAPLESGILPALRHFDRHISRSPTALVANSTAVADRIRNAYGRDAAVVHPPVDIDKWSGIDRRPNGELLWIGRLVSYKRLDVAIKASELAGIPLTIIGDGPERRRFEATAPSSVRFMGHVSDEEMAEHLSCASALVFPGEEDFGIAPVEALSAGIPVVAYEGGGALDYIKEGLNGVLVPTQGPKDFAQAIGAVERKSWDSDLIRKTAEPFSRESFDCRFARILTQVLGGSWPSKADGAVTSDA